MVFYFAYGHNTNSQVMHARIPDATYVGNATLFDYKLVMRKFADVDRSKGGFVNGAVWKMTNQELALLDEYEDLYVRRKVTVYLQGRPTMAYVYFMVDGRWMDEEPSASYLRSVERGYIEHNILGTLPSA